MYKISSYCCKGGMAQYIWDPISTQKAVYVDTAVAFRVTVKHNGKTQF